MTPLLALICACQQLHERLAFQRPVSLSGARPPLGLRRAADHEHRKLGRTAGQAKHSGLEVLFVAGEINERDDLPRYERPPGHRS